MKRRSWRWFRIRLHGLLRADTRLQRKLAPPPATPDVPKRR